MLRTPPDVLITTPESLYLMLTSRAREFLVDAEAVIVDEIHAVARTKRGAHLALTLERLEELAGAAAPADRAVGHAAAARGGGPLPRGRRPRLHRHRRGRAQAARPEDPRAGGEHARAGRPRRDRPRRAAAWARRREAATSWAPAWATSPETAHLALDLAGDLPRAAPAGPRAPLHDHLREQPPRGRAARRAAERPGRGGVRAGGSSDGRATEYIARAHHGSLAREERLSSRTCSSRASCRASWPPRRSSSASTWAPWTS